MKCPKGRIDDAFPGLAYSPQPADVFLGRWYGIMEQHTSTPTRLSSALLVGSDEVLLYTRQHILEKQGFRVSQVAPTDAVDMLLSSPPDVIIACHTLTTQEADLLVEAARGMSASPALIGFTTELAPRPTSHPFDGTVWSLASPEVFVSKVHEVLQPRSRVTSA